jgi:hypothetical protein
MDNIKEHRQLCGLVIIWVILSVICLLLAVFSILRVNDRIKYNTPVIVDNLLVVDDSGNFVDIRELDERNTSQNHEVDNGILKHYQTIRIMLIIAIVMIFIDWIIYFCLLHNRGRIIYLTFSVLGLILVIIVELIGLQDIPMH